MKGHIQNRLIAAFLSVTALPLAGVGLYSIYSNTVALRELALTSAKERARLKARKIEEMLRDIRGDIFFLARSPMLISLLDEWGRDPVQADFWRHKLGQQFLAFAQTKPVYTCLRYLDEGGREVVRAEHDGLRAWLVQDERLENRATRDYFRAAVVLPAGEVHISSADRSDGEAREPVVRYALCAIDRRGHRRGALVADVFARQVVLTVGAALLLSLLLARRIAGPLAEVRNGARRIAGGDLAHRLDVRTEDEIQELAEEFNRMGQALQETYRQLHERDLAKTEQLRLVSQQLIESEKLAAVGRLAAGVAHEINNPIGVVSMFVQRLLERGDLGQMHREKLRIIERHADRIGRVTRGLLDFARRREYRQEPVDVCRTVEATLTAFVPRLTEGRIEVETRSVLRPDGSKTEVEVIGDEEQLQQVFGNLVLNAIQAMEGGGKLIVSVEYDRAEVRVTFADTGPGIPEEHLNRVFEPFFTTKEVGQGTGLGLAISYGIVRAHGGRMAVGNRPGGGAVFTVALPVRPEEQESGSGERGAGSGER